MGNLRLSRNWHKIGTITVISAIVLFPDYTLAQVTPDQTLGNENSTVNQMDAINERIDGGAKRGGNLFHSFQEFNINEGRGVYFTNPQGVMNIFSRVTGGNASQILGKLGVLGESNLFFLNPYGIIFGPNSSLDIRGSFVGSTAESVKFADGSEFSATNPQSSALLTISVPLGLQIGNQPAAINIQGANLTVDLGQTLGIIGGNLTLNSAQLNTQGGQIILGGLSETGLVGLNFINNIPIFSFPTGVARADILIDNGTLVDVRGLDGGTIEINARNLDITGFSKITAETGDFGIIKIIANDIALSQFASLENVVFSQANNNSGSIEITTDTLSITGGASIATSSYGQGNAGIIKIIASDTITLTGIGQISPDSKTINSTILPGAEGNSQGIEITTGTLFLTDGAQISARTLGKGDAGVIKITAANAITLSNSGVESVVNSGATGSSEGIEILTGSLSLTDGAIVNASTNGKGDAGAIQITTSDAISMISNSRILSTVALNAIGDSGGIEITTGSLSLTDGAIINANTEGKGNAGAIKITARDTISAISDSRILSVVADPTAIGNSGVIEITTGSLSLNNGARINASNEGKGNAGAIKITARDTISLADENSQKDSRNSGIFSRVAATAQGNSGGIEITTGSLSLNNGAIIDANTNGKGDAGAIKITARDTISLANDNSQKDSRKSAIVSQVERLAEGGNSGGIEITTTSLSLTDKAKIDASTNGKGDAGAIKITASHAISVSNDSKILSQVSSKNTIGNSGGIEITTGSLSLNNEAEIDASTEGKGNAGAIKITASDTISMIDDSKILNTVESKAIGNSGGIEITTGSFFLTDGALINASTFGSGNAGAIKITASDTISITNDNIKKPGRIRITSRVADTAQGNSGGIEITTGSLYLNDVAINVSTAGKGTAGNITITANTLESSDDSRIQTDTRNKADGDAGDITLNISDTLTLSNSNLTAETTSAGKAGDITINSPKLNLTEGAFITAQTSALGDGGSITVNAPISLILGENTKLNVETSNSGRAGNINITSDTVTIGKNAQISATATLTATNTESGSININASNLNIAGQLGIFAETQGQTPAGTLTLNPDGSKPSINIRFIEEGIISASTFASGIGGDINISAPDTINLRGNGTIAVETLGSGNAGTINFNTNQLNLAEGVRISASTKGTGNAGNINLNALQVNLQQATITAFTNGQGNAGNINVPNAQIINLDNSTISTEIQENGAGSKPSNITLTSDTLNLNNSSITANSQGIGDAGNLTLNIQNTLQSNNSTISTAATQASGGSINISAGDIRLQGNSDIRTNVASGAGGGGDITLTADSIVAFNDSDILAFAQDGIGGNISLNTPIFFGNGYQATNENQNPDTLDNNHLVDINASGAVSGVISVPDLTFIQNSLFELPETLINTENLLANSCVVPHQQKAGTFILTGPDELPVRPNTTITSPYPTGTVETIPTPSNSPSQPKIVEPQGFYRLPTGQIVLSKKCF